MRSLAAVAPDAVLCPGLGTCPKRSALLARLWGDVDGRLAAFESELASVEAEKAVKVLGAFATVLERLTALDTSLAEAAVAEDTDDGTGETLEDLRAELDALLSGGPRPGRAARDPRQAERS